MTQINYLAKKCGVCVCACMRMCVHVVSNQTAVVLTC